MEYLLKIQHFTSQVKLYDKPLFINADHDSVVEAIINLITNSMKFSPNKKNIFISTIKENNFVIVSVEDEGIGISIDDQTNIFSPFFQSNNLNVTKSSGSGLGLAIVKNILNAHKGKITLQSTLGKGSRFNLYFPIAEDKNE